MPPLRMKTPNADAPATSRASPARWSATRSRWHRQVDCERRPCVAQRNRPPRVRWMTDDGPRRAWASNRGAAADGPQRSRPHRQWYSRKPVPGRAGGSRPGQAEVCGAGRPFHGSGAWGRQRGDRGLVLVVTSRTAQPGAPETVAEATTSVPSGTSSRSPIPAAGRAQCRRGQLDGARLGDPDPPRRTQSRIERVSTAFSGSPITWPGRCASELPTRAATARCGRR